MGIRSISSKLSQKMASTLFFAIIISVAALASSSSIAAAAAGSDEVFVMEGQRADILCENPEPLIYCRIEVPGQKNVYILTENQTGTDFKYHGRGRKNGECGITIEHVKAHHNGEVRCYMGTEGNENIQKVNLYITVPAQRPQLELSVHKKHRVLDGAFKIDEIISAKCTSSAGRPGAKFVWYMDTNMLSEEFIGKVVEKPSKATNQTLPRFTVSQTVTMPMIADYENRSLICHAEQPGLKPQAATEILKVGYGPKAQPESELDVPAGQTALINVTVSASPLPNTTWIVGNTRIAEGDRNGRFEAYTPIGIGNGIYNVTLCIVELQPADVIEPYRLVAANQYGEEHYTVKISAKQPPAVAETLEDKQRVFDMSAWLVGVGTVAVVLAVALLLVARATGRWCFGRAEGAVESGAQEKV